MGTLRLINIFIAVSFVGCGQVDDDLAETPEGLGTIFTGGKADEASHTLGVFVREGRERLFRFSSRGDLDIVYEPKDEGDDHLVEFRVKSRTAFWPNWFWELGAVATCEAI